MRRDRTYASAIACTTTRMNRLASTSRSAAEQARLFVRLPAGIQATGLGRSTIYRLVASGAFPRPVHLGPRAIAWRWSDLETKNPSRINDLGFSWGGLGRPETALHMVDHHMQIALQPASLLAPPPLPFPISRRIPLHSNGMS